MKRIFFLFCILFSINALAKIDVAFVPANIKQGDTVELVFSSETPFQHIPNLDILKQDFVIGGQQRRQSAQWVNGKGQTSYQLVYTLFPNKSGTITVQGLKIGSENLPDLTLNIQADAAYETQGDIALSIQCPNDSVYPAQKMLCRVYLDDNLGLVDGELQAPQTSAGTWEEIQPLTPLKQQPNGGLRYQSVFAFTPTISGQLEISPFSFYGQARLKTRPSAQYSNIIDFMFMGLQQSTATKPVNAQSKPITLTVKEKPANYQGWWLPSTQVTLKESLDLPENIHSGEPIVRTLTLVAQGVSAAAMPVPSAPQTPGLKVYANPEKRQDLPTGGEVSVTLTFVPTQAGRITLPPIQVTWFNTLTEKIEQASVPAHNLIVLGDTTPVQTADNKVAVKPAVSPTQPEGNSVAAETTPSVSWLLLGISIGVAFCLGLLVALFILKRQNRNQNSSKKKKPLPDLYPF